MKRFIKLTTIAVLFSCSICFAQDNRMANSTPEQRAQMRVERYSKDVNLSPEQATQLKELFLKQEDLRDQQQEKQKEFRQNFDKELNKILTPEQQIKLKEIRHERRNQSQLQKEEGKKNGTNEEVK